MDRLNRLTATGIDGVDLRDIRPSMLNYCTRLAERMTAYKLRRMQEEMQKQTGLIDQETSLSEITKSPTVRK
ncbi:MAG: hypothetical protein JKY56_03435 [Kofleriaceae bacterium]|nr:hypothetical protein [Kofleriaceae bacterium]